MTDAIDELLVALKPFAEFAGTMADHTPATMQITMGSSMARRQLTIGDVKLARDTYHKYANRQKSEPDAPTHQAKKNVTVVSDTELPDAPF